jgi:hypothetical protein
MATALEEIKIVKVKAASAAGTTAIESDAVDLADYDGVLFLTTVGAIVTGGVQSMKVQHGDTTTPATDVTDLSHTVEDDDDNNSYALDFVRKDKRYARCVISRATQNSTWGEIYALLYGAKLKPVVSDLATFITKQG